MLFTLALLIIGLTARTADAQVLVYSDTTTFSGFAFSNGGAALSGTNTTTKLVADDITMAPGFGPQYSVNQFTFSVANLNSTAVSARPLVRFYNNNGTSGGPGTFITGFNFNPISFAASAVQLFTFSQANMFTLPSSGTLWAGMSFDNNAGTTGATLAQLNNLG